MGIIRLAEVDCAADGGVHLAPPSSSARPLVRWRFDRALARPGTGRSLRSSAACRTAPEVAASGHAIAHDGRDLWDPGGRDDGVVAEDAAEIVFVGKDLFLQREKNAGRVDEIDERQPILHGDALRAQTFLPSSERRRRP